MPRNQKAEGFPLEAGYEFAGSPNVPCFLSLGLRRGIACCKYWLDFHALDDSRGPRITLWLSGPGCAVTV
jgi:hypothetical protein